MPANGFVFDDSGYVSPTGASANMEVAIKKESDRLQALAPFGPWDGNDFDDMPVLLKAKGKCTTDHISPAGPWLKYRGHLDNISGNMFLGAINAFTDEAGKGKNVITGEGPAPFHEIARSYKAKEVKWVVIGGDNYGEGSSREHAAMSPRFLGAAAVICRSFARIHETNLKKQGILPLTFANPDDYGKVKESDLVSITGLGGIAPGAPLMVTLKHAGGASKSIEVRHTLSEQHIEWFKAGSALNHARKKRK